MTRHLWKMVVAIVIMASFVLAGCAGTPTTPAPVEPSTGGSEGTTDSGGTSDKAPVTLTFIKIADELEAKAFAEMVAAFQQSEGGKWSYVSVEYDAKPFSELFRGIETAVATNSGVDLIQADGPDVKHFAHNGVLMDLTQYFSAEELAQFAPQSVEEGSYRGQFYAAPQNQSCQLMWYNQAMVDAAGLDLGTEGLTYGTDGTGLPAWQKLTVDENGDGTPEVYGVHVNGPNWFDYLNRIAARTNGVPGDPTYNGVSEDGLGFVGYFDTPEAIAAYQFDQDLIYEYKVRSSEPPVNTLLSGFAAMTLQQDMILGTLKDQFPDFQIGAMQPPYWQTPMCHTGSWHFGIASNTDNFEEALAFVKFASGPEGAQFIWKYKNQMPALTEMLNTLPEFQTEPRSIIKDFFVEHGAPRITSPAYTEYNALFTEFYQAVIAGGDVEQLAHDYAQQMEEAAAKYKE